MSPTCGPTAIILAAGRSRRMGGRNKLLLDVGGSPVLYSVLQAFAKAPMKETIVVTGAEHDRVSGVVEQVSGARTVHNPDFGSGMASSIRQGVRAAGSDVVGYALCPGDLPLLSGNTVQRLCQVFAAQESPCVVAPTYHGQQGHPVIFAAHFREQLLALEGDSGARNLVRSNEAPVTRMPVCDDGILQDVDTPEALTKLRRRAEQN